MATSTLSNSGLIINGSSDSITGVDASGNALTTGSKVPRFSNYSGSSTALTLPWTATANGWLRIQCINTGSSNNRVTIDNFAVAGSDVTRKADYSDYYFYSVVPVAAGQVVNKVGSATVFLPRLGESLPSGLIPSQTIYAPHYWSINDVSVRYGQYTGYSYTVGGGNAAGGFFNTPAERLNLFNNNYVYTGCPTEIHGGCRDNETIVSPEYMRCHTNGYKVVFHFNNSDSADTWRSRGVSSLTFGIRFYMNYQSIYNARIVSFAGIYGEGVTKTITMQDRSKKMIHQDVGSVLDYGDLGDGDVGIYCTLKF